MQLQRIESLMRKAHKIRGRVPGYHSGPAADLPWIPRAGAGIGWGSILAWRRACERLAYLEDEAAGLIADGFRREGKHRGLEFIKFPDL